MTLLEQEILEGRVIQNIEDTLSPDFDEMKVEKEAQLFEDLGADSLDMMTILMGLEEEFEIEIEDLVLSTWKSVQDIINYITKRMEEENGS